MRLLYALLFCGFAGTGVLSAQAGCADPQASNFDPGATVNDGSCNYPVTNYTLTLKSLLPTTLNETSGLAFAGGAVWTHNDSGNPAQIFKIDTVTGSILQIVNIGGATNIDWEDIAFDGANFYIGDFGNNANGNRTNLKIYKFPLSAIPSGANVTVSAAQVKVINFSYEDQVNFAPQGSNNTSFDCESLIFRDDELHLFTKDWINHSTTHYTLPNTPGTYEAVNQETFFTNGLITAADITIPGVIILQGYESSGGPVFFWLLFDYQPGVYFSGNKRRIELGTWSSSGQTEGICFRNNGYGYISNERVSAAIPARLFSFGISQWLQPGFLPVELMRFTGRPAPFGALLEWETASEHENIGFAVERSEDGISFRQIGFVSGLGDNDHTQQYRFEDREPGGTRYYRLRQADADGSEYLSDVVAVTAASLSACHLMIPNPVSPGAAMFFPADWPEDAGMFLFDSMGRVAWQAKPEQNILPSLSQGLYILKVTGGETGADCISKIVVGE